MRIALLALLLLAFPALAEDAPSLQAAESLSKAFRQVAGQAGPAVVSIITTRLITQDGSFEDLFPEGFRPRFRMPAPRFEARGQGSGVVVDAAKGLVLTNHHVVRGAGEVRVRLRDGREFPGKVKGTDPNTDLALVQVEAQDLQAARLGDSDRLEPGDWVLAIGAPFGLEQTVTAGIVSAKGRADVDVIHTPYAEQEFIQTDAAINPGNSGGPLLNLRGEVVGINTAIAGSGGGNVGIGFAIPSNQAKRILQDLLEKGRVARGWMGVKIQDLTPELSTQFGAERGVLVGEVLPGTPAGKAGLEAGDIVLEVGGEKVPDTAALRRKVAAEGAGREIQVRIFRGGRERTLSVTLGEQPGDEEEPREEPKADRLGLSVRPSPEEDGGVQVDGVEPGSPASRSGLRVGDLVLSVDRREVSGVREFRDALEKADLPKGILLRVRSEEGSRWLVLKP